MLLFTSSLLVFSIVVEEGDQYEGIEESSFTKFAGFSRDPFYCLEGMHFKNHDFGLFSL
jgi:hypothetical protein